MNDDMTARRFSEATQMDYVGNVRNLTDFLGQSPDTPTSDDLRRFQLHMAQQQISPGSINAAIAALRFFFTVTLERPDLVPVDRTGVRPAGNAGRRPFGGGQAQAEVVLLNRRPRPGQWVGLTPSPWRPLRRASGDTTGRPTMDLWR
jgi:hypothetical protein